MRSMTVREFRDVQATLDLDTDQLFTLLEDGELCVGGVVFKHYYSNHEVLGECWCFDIEDTAGNIWQSMKVKV